MSKLRPRFWETVPLDEMTHDEWEALCDGCGKCCMNKIEYEDTGEVYFTSIACRLYDAVNGGCSDYANRHRRVPGCAVMTPETLPDIAYWMPSTCAYKRLWKGEPLPEWHPLVTGDPDSTRKSGNSMIGRTVSELDVPEEDWENFIIDDVHP